MVAVCAMVLPILKKKLEIAELMLEHGAGTCFNGTAYNGTECSGTACNQLLCTTAVLQTNDLWARPAMWHSLRWHSLQCSTTCNGRICNVGPPRGYLARPEGAEDAGAPGQLSLAVETGSLAFIASAADCLRE